MKVNEIRLFLIDGFEVSQGPTPKCLVDCPKCDDLIDKSRVLHIKCSMGNITILTQCVGMQHKL
jgi:hypothetical protein